MRLTELITLCFHLTALCWAAHGWTSVARVLRIQNHASLHMQQSSSGALENHVAVVTGASRGIGKGIALALGQKGATVYVTGRSAGGKSTTSVGGSLEQTVEEINRSGGKGIPVACDHGDDGQVEALFERVRAEQGRLHLLVNNAFQADQILNLTGSFWEQGAGSWDSTHRVGLRSHYIASCFAAPLMIETAVRSGAPPGLIAHISSFGGLTYTFKVAYGVQKCAVDRMASDMAIELEEHNVAAVSVWPGVVKTERMQELYDSGRWQQEVGLPIDCCETPLFVGRAVAALAADPGIMKRSGKVQVVAELAKELKFTDVDGSVPPSIRSLRFLLPNYVFPSVLPKGVTIPPSLIPDLLVPMDSMRGSKSPKITTPKPASN